MRREGRKGRKGSDGKGREEKRGEVFSPRNKCLAPPLLYVTHLTAPFVQSMLERGRKFIFVSEVTT